jgi:hypothetical protein
MNIKIAFVRTLSVSAASLALCGVLAAQTPSTAPPPQGQPPGGRDGFRAMGGGPDDGIRFLGFEAGLGEKTVTGAPFSATFTTSTSQTLADGNKIQRNSAGSVARDAQGRMRREMTLPPGPWADTEKTPPHVIFINDPIAGANYILKVDDKTGTKFTPPADRQRPADSAAASDASAPDDKDVVKVSLGTQTINGVSAEGTRTTRTIPAGAIGNANPIQITVEKWYAPSLQLYVMIKRSDPRSGDSVFQLTGIQTTEPAATLFQVPSDYTITAGSKGRGHRGGPPPPPQQ